MTNIGGQAVIEGVMMKVGKGWTVAVRDQKGEVHLKVVTLGLLPKLFRIVFIRGVAALFYALSIGIRALEFSASKAYGEEEKQMSSLTIAATMAFAGLLGIGLFMFLPLYLTKLLGLFFGAVSENSFLFNLVDGVIRVMFFLLYVLGIGLWKDMGRIFEYHGAEHKVIHAYEAGRLLNVASVKPFSRLHPRCGTSFLLIVMVISILVFSFVPQTWPFSWKFLSRLILIPVIAGISYEILRLSARIKDNPIIKLLVMPGLMLQRLTTREPDDLQIEVAITALEEALKLEGKYAAAEA